MKGRIFRVVSVLGISSAMSLLALTAAGASTASHHGTVMGDASATTRIVNDPDSGGDGNWAYDDFTRVARIFPHGSVADSFCGTSSGLCYAFTATLTDFGRSSLIPGAFAPNQGGSYLGQKILHPGVASMQGYGDFTTFYATAMPNASMVPHFITGSPQSSLFPGRFFPAGSVTGLNEATWSYSYDLSVHHVRWVWVLRHHRWHLVPVSYQTHQHWTDAYDNNGGQGPGDGQVTG